MKDRELIGRLLELRRQREQRANEAAIRCQSAVEQAARETSRAAAAVDAQLERASAAEREAYGGMLERPVGARELLQVRGRFDREARTASQLEENMESSRAAEAERRTELKHARRNHEERLRSVIKLEKLMEQADKRAAGRRVALAELSDEDERAPQSGPPAARR